VDKDNKFLTFALADEEYGIAILKVREIITLVPITMVPRTAGFVKGVINLRGKVIPVIDLRVRLGMEAIEFTDQTCIIVVDVSSRDDQTLTGIVVDKVSEVLNIHPAEIEETPSLGINLDMNYILGMAKTGAGIKILLNIDLVLNTSEVSFIETGTSEAIEKPAEELTTGVP
jgi:purine-binding chemotaxis protein CheW